MTDIKKKDLYLLLGIKEDASTQQIRKAYRKAALKYHPDKNPDDEKAAELFHELSEALKILTDIGARAAYDHVRSARKAAAERTAKLDAGRKRAKLDLDMREKAAAASTDIGAEDKLKIQIERLRDEGSRILQEETDAIKKQLRDEAKNLASKPQPATLKVKWKIPSEGGVLYNENSLRDIFSKHGHVTGLVVSVKKKYGTAIIELNDARGAKSALDSEIGFLNSPLSVSWLSGVQPRTLSSYTSLEKNTFSKESTAPLNSNTNETSDLNVDELEELVFAKIKRKKEQNGTNT